MIIGIVLATAGGSMIWPFLMIYASDKLDLPLSTVATLISINAGTGLVSSLIAGTLADRIGRKVVMNFSLTLNGIAYFLLMYAHTYPQFVGLMILIGLSNPLYQVGADAMLADMIPSEKRDAYAINRIANNAAFALGPAIGGFLATRSYNLAFYCAGIGFLAYSLLLFFLANETLRPLASQKCLATQVLGFRRKPSQPAIRASFATDKNFMVFVFAVSIGLDRTHHALDPDARLRQDQFRHPRSPVRLDSHHQRVDVRLRPISDHEHHTAATDTPVYLAVGMLIYALGAGSVALMTGFWGFWLSMVILTFGELTLVPTASKYVADLAPADLRGRYMSISLAGLGPGAYARSHHRRILNDNIAPQAIWIGGLLIGLTSTFGLFLLSRRSLVPNIASSRAVA